MAITNRSDHHATCVRLHHLFVCHRMKAFGSPRQAAKRVAWNAVDGEPSRRVRRFDLQPLYQPMRTILGEINIEGAMVIGDELVLLNRGVTGRSDNAATRYPLRNLLDAIEAKRSNVAPTSIRRYGLEAIDGAGLGFTDGTALLDGSWVFSAVAENRDDSCRRPLQRVRSWRGHCARRSPDDPPACEACQDRRHRRARRCQRNDSLHRHGLRRPGAKLVAAPGTPLTRAAQSDDRLRLSARAVQHLRRQQDD